MVVSVLFRCCVVVVEFRCFGVVMAVVVVSVLFRYCYGCYGCCGYFVVPLLSSW